MNLQPIIQIHSIFTSFIYVKTLEWNKNFVLKINGIKCERHKITISIYYSFYQDFCECFFWTSDKVFYEIYLDLFKKHAYKNLKMLFCMRQKLAKCTSFSPFSSLPDLLMEYNIIKNILNHFTILPSK